MTWSTAPDWISAVAAALTLAASALVLREARRIRHNEMFHALLGLWGEYNAALVSSGFSDAYGDVYECRFKAEDLTGSQRQALWSLYNALQYTWTLSKDGLLHDIYDGRQAAAWFFGLKPKREFFLTLFRDAYSHHEFYAVAARLMECATVDEATTEFERLRKDGRYRRSLAIQYSFGNIPPVMAGSPPKADAPATLS